VPQPRNAFALPAVVCGPFDDESCGVGCRICAGPQQDRVGAGREIGRIDVDYVTRSVTPRHGAQEAIGCDPGAGLGENPATDTGISGVDKLCPVRAWVPGSSKLTGRRRAPRCQWVACRIGRRWSRRRGTSRCQHRARAARWQSSDPVSRVFISYACDAADDGGNRLAIQPGGLGELTRRRTAAWATRIMSSPICTSLARNSQASPAHTLHKCLSMEPNYR
jgi:hypothetical protein